MDKILTIVLIVLILVFIKEYFFTKNEHFVDKQVTLNIPETWPMTAEFAYDNMDNLIENDTIRAINELTDMVLDNVNKNQPMIIYNNAMRQSTPLKPNDLESTDYGKFLVEKMNEVAIYKYYEFNKINNISKDQVEHQMRLNFHIEMLYNSKKTGDKVPLSFNVVMLFEQPYDDDEKFHNPDYKPEIRSYLDTFRLNGLPNRGFLPGVVQK